MEEMQQHNMSWIEVQFLKKAVDILCECRRTLMYTYVFAYYLKKNNESEIFEVSNITLLPILRFLLDEKFQRNASKFAIFYIYENPSSFFRFSFRATLYIYLMNALVYVKHKLWNWEEW